VQEIIFGISSISESASRDPVRCSYAVIGHVDGVRGAKR
jgi:hypothetical protein